MKVDLWQVRRLCSCVSESPSVVLLSYVSAKVSHNVTNVIVVMTWLYAILVRSCLFNVCLRALFQLL